MRSRSVPGFFAFLALLLLGIAGWWMLRGEEAPRSPSAPSERTPASRVPDEPQPLPETVIVHLHEGGTVPPARPAVSGTLNGIVVYSGKQDPAPGVRVELTRGKNGESVGEATTGEDGRFTIERAPVGQWNFRTCTPGDVVDDLEHTTVRIAEGQTADIKLYVAYVVPEGEGIAVTASVTYEDGTVPETFSFQVSGTGRALNVHGKEGRASPRFPGAGSYDLYDFIADGESHDYRHLTQNVADGSRIEVILQLAKRRTLIVIDRQSGAALPGARVHHRAKGNNSWFFRHYPSPETAVTDPVVADGAGRVDLGTSVGEQTLYVIAEGYAWKFLEVPADAATEVTVRLIPGGDVRLNIPRWKELKDAGLYSVKEGEWEKWVLPKPVGGTEVRLTGLPAGTRQFVVHLGNWYDDAEILGQATAEVLAGGETTVTVDATPPDARRLVEFRGTITIPAAWGRKRIILRLEGAEPSNKSVERLFSTAFPNHGKPVDFNLKPLPPGKYQVHLEPQVYTTVVVPEGGGEHHFVAPEPVEVRIRVVEKASGKDVEAMDVSWFMSGEGRNSWTHEQTERDPVTKEFVFHAPPGEAVIHLNSGGWIRDPEAEGSDNFWGTNVTVPTSGPFRATFQMVRAGTVRVVLKGAAIDIVGEDIDVSIEQKTEHGSTSHNADFNNGVALRDDLMPGRYTVTMDVPEDLFEKVTDQEIDVVGGRVTEVVIELRKK